VNLKNSGFVAHLVALSISRNLQCASSIESRAMKGFSSYDGPTVLSNDRNNALEG
jgi:hypothetical protein